MTLDGSLFGPDRLMNMGPCLSRQGGSFGSPLGQERPNLKAAFVASRRKKKSTKERTAATKRNATTRREPTPGKKDDHRTDGHQLRFDEEEEDGKSYYRRNLEFRVGSLFGSAKGRREPTMREEEGNPKRDTWQSTRASTPHGGDEEEMKLWGVFAFALIGATATTFAVTRLRRTVDWVYSQLNRSRESARSFRTAFQEDAWKRYNKRMQEAYEEEMERVERIKRMQNVFSRERNKNRRGYEGWKENETGGYNQQFQRDDWYWKAETSFRNQWAHSEGAQARRQSAPQPLSHHYSVLGLNRSRKTPYTDAEIKTAFRAKAMEFHPDQNQSNKEAAEAKFKEVLKSYEAIKKERNK